MTVDQRNRHLAEAFDRKADAQQVAALPFDDWMAAGRERYGDESKAWRLRCPVCGHVATPEDYRALDAPERVIGFACIGRFIDGEPARNFGSVRGANGATAPCDYTSGGLFNVNPIRVSAPNDKGELVDVWLFDFADRPLRPERTKP